MGAVYGNRNRLRSGVGKEAMRKRGEVVERSFAHVLDRGGIAAHGCGAAKMSTSDIPPMSPAGILMRTLLGAGTPKEVASFANAFVFVIHAADAIAIVVVASLDAEIAILILAIAPDAV